jgi:phosphate transport system permease protein
VLGQALRLLSQQSWLSWVPGYPLQRATQHPDRRLPARAARGPDDFHSGRGRAEQRRPGSFKEASFALGASRLQTIVKIIVPASLSGIVSAVLLGLGRVIGETMVVLLCAGNRISIPDFSEGLAVVTQPVHTMTGIIAQEMGEVVRGSIHYRALFVVGLVLFFLSLLINYAAQGIVRRVPDLDWLTRSNPPDTIYQAQPNAARRFERVTFWLFRGAAYFVLLCGLGVFGSIVYRAPAWCSAPRRLSSTPPF